jgi:hypothetical protein
MDGPPNRAAALERPCSRHAESSRLQLDLVRRAFELLVPVLRHTIVPTSARRTPRSAAVRSGQRVAGA